MTTYYGSWDVYSLNYSSGGNKISLGSSPTPLFSGLGLDTNSTDGNAVTSAPIGSGKTLGSSSTGGGGNVNGDYFVGTISADGNTVYIITDGAGDYFGVVSHGASLSAGISSTTVPSNTAVWTLQCFAAGTMIATPTGERAVESLAAGDMVLTADGAAKPVRWLGQTTRSRPFADPARTLPVRIKAGALGENLPTRDLVVSPGHALLINDVLVQAGALVNGTTVTVERQGPETFTFYHVETDAHDLLVAEGVVTESFLVGVEDIGFDNWAERPAGAAPAELSYPRVKSARQLPAAVRELIAARVVALAPEMALAA